MNILTSQDGEFIFINKDGDEETFSNWNDIPEDYEFLHVIKFKPAIPPSPHTPEQHLEIAEWNDRMKTLLEKERASRNKNR